MNGIQIDRRFNSDLRAISNTFKGVSPENKSIVSKPVGKLIVSYVRERIGREVNNSLYSF